MAACAATAAVESLPEAFGQKARYRQRFAGGREEGGGIVLGYLAEARLEKHSPNMGVRSVLCRVGRCGDRM